MMSRIKNKLHALVFWQTRLGEIANKLNDLKLFYKYSFTEKKINSQESYQAFLTKQYHIVEKGLALPDPRKGFGKPKIILLIKKANRYIEQYGEDRIIVNIKETVQHYLDRNTELETNDLNYYNTIINFINNHKTCLNGGVKLMKLSEIETAVAIDFECFLKTRTSVRDFSEEDVRIEEVEKVVDLARFTPSVCNRQSWKVYLISNKELKNELLKLQGGNNGFTDSINKLLIVSVDTRKFTQLESNQIFVDGGLFSMNLLLSLHSQKIASCCLNLCVPYIIENKIKKLANIPQAERLIMMIGIGKFKENFEVAISDRRDLTDILKHHN
ncbi:MAG TPA: nitroreductase family protein [Flavobacterium sp.]